MIKTMTDEDFDALSVTPPIPRVPCPVCGAPPWAMCIDERSLLDGYHDARKRIALAVQAQKSKDRPLRRLLCRLFGHRKVCIMVDDDWTAWVCRRCPANGVDGKDLW